MLKITKCEPMTREEAAIIIKQGFVPSLLEEMPRDVLNTMVETHMRSHNEIKYRADIPLHFLNKAEMTSTGDFCLNFGDFGHEILTKDEFLALANGLIEFANLA